MSQAPQPIQQTIVIENRSNGLGTAGFVVSLLGFLTCGLICPLGMLISFFGMFMRPRGTAIAGFVLGVVGSAWLWIAGLGVLATITGVGAAARQAARDAAKKAEEAKAAAVAPAPKIDLPAATDAPADVPAIAVDPAPTVDVPAAQMPPLPAAVEPQPSTDPTPPPFAAEPPKAAKPEREPREWQDATGQFKVTATLKSMASGKVHLVKQDGSEITVPVDKLSEDDQAYIKSQMK
jgi:hypothetical protein